MPGTKPEFLVTQQNGQVFKVNLNRPALKKEVLNINSVIKDDGNEEGLLGLALDPNYATNRFVYVYYTDDSPRRGVLARYLFKPRRLFRRARTMLEAPLAAGPTNHNGGGLEFGPGGLYLSLGDGGVGSGCTNHPSQNLDVLPGKLLRLNVSTIPATGAAGNPYSGPTPGDDRIFAEGFRNPWRFSVDPATSVIWLADVGQGSREEVNTVEPGDNYGWPAREGFIAGPNACTNIPGPFEDPEFDYSSAADGGGRCSITGGRVYRGSEIPDLVARYIYGDFCTGEIFFTPVSAPAFTPANELADLSELVSFGVDHNGELIVVTFGGLFRMEPAG
jgi:glucose/arabinose dehydrogenase